MKVDILAFGAHPDDIELACSGTLLKHIALGYSVGLVDLTRGELGTRGSADLRDQEAARAAELMGAQFRWNLRMEDGFFTHSEGNLLKVVKAIRTAQPKIILCNAISDRHPDHGKGAKLVAEAAFLSGLVKIETLDAEGKIQERWRPETLFHYIQDHNLEPDFVIDISPYQQKKMELILAFRSQFFEEKEQESNEYMDTPISGKDFLAFIEAKAKTYGRSVFAEYGEGFTHSRTPSVDDLFVLK